MKSLIYKYFKSLTNAVYYQRKKLFIQELIADKPQNLIDLGCDNGEITEHITTGAGVKTIWGVDISKERAKIAQSKGIKVIIGDLNERLPQLKNNFFSEVISIQTIEHLVEVDVFLEEIRRILKPKGFLLITTENLASWHNVFALILGVQPYTGPYLSKKYSIGHHPISNRWEATKTEVYPEDMAPHLNVMTTRALVQILTKHGFKVKLVHGIGYYPFPSFLAEFLSKIDPYHSAVCLIKAQK